jgi:Cu+-exporting ATPase
VVAEPGQDPNELLRLAAAVEAASEHPLGRAIARAAGHPLPPVEDFTATAGVGVRGRVEGREIEVGRGSPPPDSPAQDAGRLPTDSRGQAAARVSEAGIDDGVAVALAARNVAAATWVEVRVEGVVRGRLALADRVRPTSADAIVRLRRLGLRPILVTGDAQAVAEAVAAEVGITEVVAGVLPAGKIDVVKHLQAGGKVVAMVGDGVNDAAALAQADLGLAMGAGTDVAIEASDLTLVRDDLGAAVDAVRLSRRTLGIIRGNLFWAFAYNVAALPLAAAGLLNPMIAGAAMALSSVFVVANSLRLRRFEPAT